MQPNLNRNPKGTEPFHLESVGVMTPAILRPSLQPEPFCFATDSESAYFELTSGLHSEVPSLESLLRSCKVHPRQECIEHLREVDGRILASLREGLR